MDTQIEDVTCSRRHRVFATELGLSSCPTAPYSLYDNSSGQTLSLLLIILGPSGFNPRKGKSGEGRNPVG